MRWKTRPIRYKWVDGPKVVEESKKQRVPRAVALAMYNDVAKRTAVNRQRCSVCPHNKGFFKRPDIVFEGFSRCPRCPCPLGLVSLDRGTCPLPVPSRAFFAGIPDPRYST